MKNFKEIIERCLEGKLSGTFVLRNGDKCLSSTFKRDKSLLTSFIYAEHFHYSDYGHCYSSIGHEAKFDIIDFIPNNPQELKIDIPEGKVPVMEQTESGVVITWKDPELTYSQVYLFIYNSGKAISSVSSTVRNSTNTKFLTKINVLRKLINIRNYFGKPDDNENGFYINLLHQAVPNGFPSKYASETVVFAKREHAEQAIKMLGDELKYLFEPW